MNLNPPRSHNDIDTLEQITASSIPFDSLSQDEVNELGDIFRIQTTGSYVQVMQRVKRVLLEVLVLERQHFAAYLQLPKFKSLASSTIAALQIYFQTLWTAFSSQRGQQSKTMAPACDPLSVPPYPSTSAQALKQQGRVSPFDYYRAYQPYQKFGMDQHKMTFSPFPYYYNYQNYTYPSSYHTPQPQPPQIKYGNALYREEAQVETERVERAKEKIEKSQKGDKADKGDRGDKGEKSQKGEKMPKGEKSEVSISAPKSKHGSESNSQLSKALPQPPPPKKQHEPSSQNGKKTEPRPSNIINMRFLHCACTGYPIQTSQRSFQCQQCKNLFHFSCLHLPTSESKSCPLCTLTRNHIFTQAFPRAIKSGWFQVGHKECFITKLHLDEDQLGIFRRYMGMLAEKERGKGKEEEGETGLHSIEFRILRINEKAKVKPGRKIIKTSFPLLVSELRKIQSRHWIQLKLKQITEPSLIFYIMAMIKLKDKVKLTTDYLQLQPKQNLLAEWAQQEKANGMKTVMNMIHPITRRPIELPIRGQSCDHLECQDLIYFYQLFQSTAFEANNRLLCSFCKKAYTAHSKFTSDTILYAMLQNRPQNAKKIKYQSGKLEWMPHDPSAESEEGEDGSSGSQS